MIRLFTSTKAAIAVFVLIGFASLLGAIIPQGEAESVYIGLFGNFGGSLINALGLNAIFSSWWFIGALAYLIVSMSFCSCTRLPGVLAAMRDRQLLPSKENFRQFPLYFRESYPNAGEGTGERFLTAWSSILGKRRYRIHQVERHRDSFQIAAGKDEIARLGPILSHFSIVLIFAGGMWTALGSYKHFLSITEEETLPLPDTPYQIRLHDFEIRYYEDSDRPSNYQSVLEMNSADSDLRQGVLEVNKPLKLFGYRFYQMKYHPIVSDVTIEAKDQAAGSIVGNYQLPLGARKEIPELGLSLEAVDLLPDFALTKDRVAVSRTANFSNPAVMLEIYSQDELLAENWIFEDSVQLHAKAINNYSFRLSGYNFKAVSGILVVRDAAIPLVYFGFVLLSIGSFLSCSLFHRRVWVLFTRSGGEWNCYLAGSCNKNELGLEDELRLCRQDIGKQLEETEEGLE